ncbi:MAG TPA: hypothetical protein VLF62_06280 [Candidatus Saccharimonadales bacterium]|nr:hypothetical protein [Candidatus Saccharimonadales bacterium]
MGLAESPYNNQPLPPEIACVLHAEIAPQPDNTTQLSVELAIPEDKRADRTLDLVVPAGQLVVLRYMRRAGDEDLPLGERVDVVNGTLRMLKRRNFDFGQQGGRRVRTGLKVLDPGRAEQERAYRQHHEAQVGSGRLASAARQPVTFSTERQTTDADTIAGLTVQRVSMRRAALLGSLEVRRQAVLDDIVRVAAVDYVQGMFDPETARERIQDLYYDYPDEAAGHSEAS